MKTVQANIDSNISINNEKLVSRKSKIDWLMICVSFGFVAALAVWFHFDYRLPYWDAASHIQDAAKYSELFRHFHPFNQHWMHMFLTENFNYPITVHAITGFIMSLLGFSQFSVDLSLLLFALVLNLSVYGLTKILFKDTKVAALAVAFINMYPCTSSLSHVPMLDFAHLSLHCLAVFVLYYWYVKPSWTNAIFAGMALSLALTSKQIAAFFFVIPCLVLWSALLIQRKKMQFLQLTVIGLMGISSLLIWVLPNLEAIKQFSVSVPSAGGNTNQIEVFFHNLTGFFSQIPYMMSPVLFFAFLLGSCIVASKLSKLAFPLIGSCLAICLLSGIACQNPESRYLIVILLSPAIITALSVIKIYRSNIIGMKVIAVLFVTYVSAQFIALNYFPYPIKEPKAVLSFINNFIGESKPGNLNGLLAMKPTPAGDLWGQEWVIKSIEQLDKGNAIWLNVMPSTAELNVHTLELAALYEKSFVRPSTFRLWCLKGDEIKYSEKEISYFHWFLLKSGDQGLKLKDKNSEINYKKIEDYVKDSGKFYLYADRLVSDGSKLSLYRLK
jgi:hypothetical protein